MNNVNILLIISVAVIIFVCLFITVTANLKAKKNADAVIDEAYGYIKQQLAELEDYKDRDLHAYASPEARAIDEITNGKVVGYRCIPHYTRESYIQGFWDAAHNVFISPKQMEAALAAATYPKTEWYNKKTKQWQTTKPEKESQN